MVIDRRAACLIPLLWALITPGGCTRQTNPVGPEDSGFTVESSSEGSLWGSVTVVDQFQERQHDKGGVIVTIEGTPRSSITTTSGFWEFTGLPEGEYTITWTKEGFGYSRKVGIKYPGTGILRGPKAQVSQIPDFTVNNLTDSIDADTLYLRGEIVGTPAPICFARFYLGRSPTVSCQPHDHDTSFARQLFTPSGEIAVWIAPTPREILTLPRSFSIQLRRSELEAAGYASGSVIYLVGYADSPQPQSYADPETRRAIYTTINIAPSNVLRLIVP